MLFPYSNTAIGMLLHILGQSPIFFSAQHRRHSPRILRLAIGINNCLFDALEGASRCAFQPCHAQIKPPSDEGRLSALRTCHAADCGPPYLSNANPCANATAAVLRAQPRSKAAAVLADQGKPSARPIDCQWAISVWS